MIGRSSDKIIAIIKEFEELKLSIYNCSGGYKTIGFGHRILKGEYFNDNFSLIDAEGLFNTDLIKCELAISRLIKVELNNNQFDALVSFTFNLGVAALQRSTLRQKINYYSYNEAADEFLR